MLSRLFQGARLIANQTRSLTNTKSKISKSLFQKEPLPTLKCEASAMAQLKDDHQHVERSRFMVTNATVNTAKEMVVTEWNDHKLRPFPFEYLRDNCQCPKCFESSSQMRWVRVTDETLQAKAAQVDIDHNKEAVNLQWADGHVSSFDFNWLKERSFDEESRKERFTWYETKPKFWANEMQGNIPTFDFTELMNNDYKLYDWLVNMEKYGLAVLSGAPREQGQIKKVGDRVAYLRNTHYGAEYVLEAKANPSNIGYTTGRLHGHADLIYYEQIPGVQMLHCIVQTKSKGGDNEFSDSFQIANKMKEENPEFYKILTTVPADFYDVGSDAYGKFHMLIHKPIFEEDKFGNVFQCRLNDQARDSFLNIPIELVKPWYRAMAHLRKMVEDSQNTILYKMKAGDIVCFHNYRILHGRIGYEQNGPVVKRKLESGYIDWDEMRSKKRVLRKELNIQEV